MPANKIVNNPFVYGKVVKGEQFVNRINERNELITEIENHTNIIMFAPRRYGKTSLIMQTFDDLHKKRKNFTGLYFDFYRINSREKFLNMLASVYAKNSGLTLEKLINVFRNTFKGIVPSISVDQMGNPSVELKLTQQVTNSSMEEALNLPKKLADSGKLVAVLFDEFQEITALNGNDFQKELKSVLQYHNNVSYIFCGSKYHLFNDIFTHINSPLYNMGKMIYLKTIPEDKYVHFLLKPLKKLNNGFKSIHISQIYQLAGGIPYYVQMLAHELYNLCLLNQNLDPVKLIEQSNQKIISDKNEEFLIIYENLNLSSKKCLDIVLANQGKNLFTSETLNKNQLASSTLKKALNTLIERGIINRENGSYYFQDVFFKQWIERRL
jgi:hypothetical protein